MTMENPFMLEDRVPTPYSLTFELPPTPRNLQLFGYPDRIGSYTSGNSYNRSIEVVIRFNGLLIATGALILTEYDRTLKVNFSGVDFNSKLKDKMFEVPMDTIQIGGTYNVAEWDNSANYANKYRQWAKTNRYDDISGSDPRFVIAPIIRSTSDTPFSWWEHR